jgi:hypothetical protein
VEVRLPIKGTALSPGVVSAAQLQLSQQQQIVIQQMALEPEFLPVHLPI